MLTKKKRRMIKIVITVFIVIILIAVLVMLYLTTDMFKSDETLFFKYLGKNSENMSEIQNMLKNQDFEDILKSNIYTENDELTINYIEDYGTTSENTDNIINKLKLKINGETDKENDYQYKNIQLLNDDDDKSIQLELLQNNEIYQITMPELFAQSIDIENTNLEEFAEKIGYNYTGNNINFDITENLKFSEEEIEILKDKYINLIKVKVDKNDFSKKSNQKIAINGKEITANEYILKLTKEEFNNIYLDILKELKNDEIILNKIDTVQEMYNLGLQNVKQINFREVYISNIEETINNINRTNIGVDETNIIVYESKGKTVSTIIETTDYEIDFDNLFDDNKNFSAITVIENENETKKIQLETNDNNIKYTINYTEGQKPITIILEEKYGVNNKDSRKDASFEYKDDTNKIEVIYNKYVKQANNLELKESNQNSINLSDLEKEQLDIIMKTISDSISKKINEIANNESIEESIQKILKNIGFIKEAEEIISERSIRS